ncbi:MAG: Y-family DNA polymerase [Rikenellaceae bacterium]
MVGLCDCNNFFVSCQRVFRPDLHGKPVAVLSGNDGCVIARSNEVKALGIKMGVPLFQVHDIVERHKVTLFSANHRLYADMSCRVMETLRQLTPAIDIYSVDEAFIDFSGFDVSRLKSHTEEMSHTIKRNTGIPVSIGVAPTKTLAKIASKLCKEYPKLNGSCVMWREEDIEKVLRKLPIGEVWGIGRKSLSKLEDRGVYTAYDFTQLPKGVVLSLMGVVGLRTWQELKGESVVEFSSAVAAHQSISMGRSFAHDITEYDELRSIISSFAATIADKLRQQGSCVGQITTYVCTNRHNKSVQQYSQSEVVKLDVASDSTLEIVRIATESLKSIYLCGYGYKKAGVICSHLTPKEQVQSSMFDVVDRTKHTKLMETLDNINTRHGGGSVILAAQQGGVLGSNKNYLSPDYTTEWSDIISVSYEAK